MKKGQISFDLIIAIIFAVIFFSTLMLVSSQIISLQADSASRIQLRAIALNSAQLISSAQALNETGSGFSLEYNTPKIINAEKGTQESCEIIIDTAEQKITVKSANGTEETAYFKLSPASGIIALLPASLNCGETLSIQRAVQ